MHGSPISPLEVSVKSVESSAAVPGFAAPLKKIKAADSRASVILAFLPADHWSVPGAQTAAARTLIAQGCDFVCGIDGHEVQEELNATTMGGKRVLMFSKDLNYTIAPNVILAGPIRNLSTLLSIPLLALKEGSWKKEAKYPPWSSSFGRGGETFNPAFLADIRFRKVKTPDLGTIGLLELIEKREQQLADGTLNPFTGPVKDQKGKLRIPSGVRVDYEFLRTMDWFVENIKIVQIK